MPIRRLIYLPPPSSPGPTRNDAYRWGPSSAEAPPLRSLPPARSCHGRRSRLCKSSVAAVGTRPVFATAPGQPTGVVCPPQRAQPGREPTACCKFSNLARPPPASRPRSGSSSLRSGASALAFPRVVRAAAHCPWAARRGQAHRQHPSPHPRRAQEHLQHSHARSRHAHSPNTLQLG